ncbi:hypothetical protein TPHA_0L00450 [Tetrapisispora phaffii CBS 4417]|uniref:Uncharacterized protein n=1 Tax=Tetrapisispora phaffii (strain ATCC 24235 / CBS 4417 / NBRC 1672 / NRRL Y-8282 / UCD 70-5) TaxID=1071381 RepID=G8BZS3_TETPH|nr:hypothetical protein TPHA_0L00450 [Tetrapisispora phaffii CBS 4417]CCE65401.1 hypothetical protein TPHA_0L00450 [Tetrapisispora phaffii CBS 4417]
MYRLLDYCSWASQRRPPNDCASDNDRRTHTQRNCVHARTSHIAGRLAAPSSPQGTADQGSPSPSLSTAHNNNNQPLPHTRTDRLLYASHPALQLQSSGRKSCLQEELFTGRVDDDGGKFSMSAGWSPVRRDRRNSRLASLGTAAHVGHIPRNYNHLPRMGLPGTHPVFSNLISKRNTKTHKEGLILMTRLRKVDPSISCFISVSRTGLRVLVVI